MLCNSCRSLVHPPLPETTSTSLWRGGGGDRLRSSLCAGCGAVLSSGGTLDALRTKLAQLARFGLDSARRPLLGPTRRDS